MYLWLFMAIAIISFLWEGSFILVLDGLLIDIDWILRSGILPWFEKDKNRINSSSLFF